MPGASPSPDAVAASEPTPSAEPDPLQRVNAIVIRPTTAELQADDGSVVASIDYLAPAAPAVAMLTDVFEREPEVEDWPGSNHFPPATTDDWGGVTVIEARFIDGWEDRIPEPIYAIAPTTLRVEADQVGGVALRTNQGFAVGAAWDSLDGDPVFDADLYTCGGRPVETATEGDESPTVTVSRSGDAADAIGRISAPEVLAEGCA